MGRYISTTGTAGVVIRNVSANVNAAVNDRLVCNSGGGTFTVTLPAESTLLPNDTIQIVDAVGTFASSNVTIGRNGAKIQNLAEDCLLNINNTAITLVYTGTTYGWLIIR